MILAFLLVVVAGDEVVPTEGMYFRDINRCSYFAYNLEHNYVGKKQLNISAYCKPEMVSEETRFWD